MRLTEIHPVLFHARVEQLRFTKRMSDWLSGTRFARTRAGSSLEHTVMKHQSLLHRKLGTTDLQLQQNKIVNLGLATPCVDGILIRPGETFSFCKLIGDPTAEKGYLPGMELWGEESRAGVGGGICQIANLLYWMALHTPLQVVERHHHSFDPFPDDRRVLPFGSGATVFYNYVDLRFRNPTEQTFQFRIWLTPEHLQGAVCTDRTWPLTYRLEERNHRFLKQNGKNYRENEIWRTVVDTRTGKQVQVEQLMHNFGEVKYEPPNAADS